MLLRRVPRRPTVLLQDPLTGDFVILPEAFTYDHGSGLSVSIGQVAHSCSKRSRDVMDWASHGAAIFPVHLVRSEVSGIVPTPTETDPTHGCVRVKSDRVKAHRREQWLPLRSRLREAATYCDSEDVADELWLGSQPRGSLVGNLVKATVPAAFNQLRTLRRRTTLVFRALRKL